MKAIKARNKISNNGPKKLDRDKILAKIAEEERFQREQSKREEYLPLSKGQRKKFYEKMIASIKRVIKLNEKLGIKSKDYSSYYKNKLEIVNEKIAKSQSKLKRIVLIEK